MQGSIDFTGLLSGNIDGSGTSVIANPEGTATDTLNKVQIDDTIYSIESGGGSTVTITPSLESGTKVADFTIDETSGSLYAPTPESPIEYTAGANIQISEENVISATDTTYTAGNNITIENGVISASGGSSLNYSTDEQVVGTWIDGRNIYQKTIELSSEKTISNNNWTSIDILAQSLNIDFYIGVVGQNTTGTCWNALSVATINNYISLTAWRNGDTISVKYVTIQYCKSL